jgi:hypothetical protein
MNTWTNEDPPADGPVAYLHILHMEGDQRSYRLSFRDESAFGTPGRDHSEEYPVTIEPLFRSPA